MGTDWDRLDHWPLFEEGFVLVAPADWKESSIKLSAIAGNCVITRPYCESLAVRKALKDSDDFNPEQQHEVSSDEDAVTLIARGLGVAVMPESSGRLLADSAIAIDGLEQTRTVGVYDVAGRQRSAAATGLLKLLRAADWATATPA